MNKKVYIIKFLEKVIKFKPEFGKILENVKNDLYEEDIIDQLFEEFRTAINETTNEGLKEKLEQGYEVLSQIKRKEGQERINEQKELDEFEKMIEDL